MGTKESKAPEQLDEARKKELGINDDVKGLWIVDVDPKGATAEAGLRKSDAIIPSGGFSFSFGANFGSFSVND
jgi:serine protease Do